MIGPQSHTPRFSNDDKNLIAEQPGRFVLFVGVLLAITLGLSLRGLVAPNKVKAHIAAAASSINKDLNVRFESASISLSRGLLPRFAVLITNVRMESSNACWMTPLLTADEIRLPLSFWALVRGENPVTEVSAGKVTLDLRSDFKNCETIAPVTRPLEVPAVTQFVTLKNKKSQNASSTPSPQVEAIGIDELTLISTTLSAPLELTAFAIRLKSNAPRVIEMTAKTRLIRDDKGGDYLSHASIWGEYTEFPKTQILGRITGNWREGSYQAKASYFLKEEELTSELDLKHVPLSQLAQVLKKFNWLKADLDARQVWMSVNAQMSGKSSDLKKAKMQLKDLRLEGDLGNLQVSQAEVHSFEPLSYSPFQVDIEQLNIQKLLLLDHRSSPSPVFGSLGVFTGKALITSGNDIQISGVHRGIEFIFSNKGQREIQTLKEIATDLKLEKNRWNLSAANVIVDQGLLDGTLQVSADRDWRNFDVEGKATQVRLAPNVIRLMTAGGQVGPLNGEVRMKLREGVLSSLKGVLNAEGVSIEGVEISKSRWQLDSANEEIIAQAQVQRLTVSVGSPTFQVLKDVIEPEWMNEGRLGINNLTSQLQFRNLNNFSWKNLSAQLEKPVRVLSDGRWDENGTLSGQIQTVSGKTTRRWVVGGRRDTPQIALDETIKKKKQ